MRLRVVAVALWSSVAMNILHHRIATSEFEDGLNGRVRVLPADPEELSRVWRHEDTATPGICLAGMEPLTLRLQTVADRVIQAVHREVPNAQRLYSLSPSLVDKGDVVDAWAYPSGSLFIFHHRTRGDHFTDARPSLRPAQSCWRSLLKHKTSDISLSRS